MWLSDEERKRTSTADDAAFRIAGADTDRFERRIQPDAANREAESG